MITVLQPDPHVSAGRFADWLTQAGHELHTVALWQEKLPILADCGDGILLLGGTMNSQDEQASPWLPGLHELLKQAHAAHLPVFGICLGHQIIASAFGGEVGLDVPGQGQDGPARIELTAAGAADPILGAMDSRGIRRIVGRAAFHSRSC